jgi:polygalacturonase
VKRSKRYFASDKNGGTMPEEEGAGIVPPFGVIVYARTTTCALQTKYATKAIIFDHYVIQTSLYCLRHNRLHRGDNRTVFTIPRRNFLTGAGIALLPGLAPNAFAGVIDVFNVRDYGAKGDAVSLDTNALQRAIDAAANIGGGTVFLPQGRYLSFSIHLHSRITLLFASGAVLVAADPARHGGSYDPPEPNPYDTYQDYGHSYFHNSLIWGENIEDIAILGPGLIDGIGLTNESPGAPWSIGIGRNLPPSPQRDMAVAEHEAAVKKMYGLGNKAIALKNVRNVTMRDFSILRGGHFGVIATGVDNLTMDNLKIDTNRDGIDLDVVRNARLSNLSVNAPTDDAIVLKSSYALGAVRPTENVTITNCFVSGYDLGTMLDGSCRKSVLKNLEPHLTSGRIKLGTESTGGYRNIAISNCVFDCCNGLALESVDGAALEDVVVDNLVMRDLTVPPIFIRLGDRRRAPKGAPMATLRRVSISNIDATVADRRYASIVTGVPGGLVEDVSIDGLRVLHQGRGTKEDAGRRLAEAVEAYPDPDMFGITPSWGLYLRHIRGLRLRDIEMSVLAADARPAAVKTDIAGLRCRDVFASSHPAAALKPLRI